MLNLIDNIQLASIIEQIKQIDENVIIEPNYNVEPLGNERLVSITVTNCNKEYLSYLVLLFGKVVVKH